MTRRSKREIERAVQEAKPEPKDDTGALIVFTGCYADVPEGYVHSEEMGHPEASAHHEVLLPVGRPPEFREGITIVNAEELLEWWNYILDREELREREIAAREEHGLPFPDALESPKEGTA